MTFFNFLFILPIKPKLLLELFLIFLANIRTSRRPRALASAALRGHPAHLH